MIPTLRDRRRNRLVSYRLKRDWKIWILVLVFRVMAPCQKVKSTIIQKDCRCVKALSCVTHHRKHIGVLDDLPSSSRAQAVWRMCGLTWGNKGSLGPHPVDKKRQSRKSKTTTQEDIYACSLTPTLNDYMYSKFLSLIVLAELKRDLVNFNFYMIFRSFDPLKPLYVLNHSLMIFNDQ